MPGAREVRRARASLVGPGKHDVRPAAQDESAASRLDREMAGGLAGKRVVDVGCGGGILTEAMAARGAVRSASISAKRRSASRGCTSSNPAARRLSSASRRKRSPPKRPGAFDVVTCMELLEHVPDPAPTVAACAELAKPGGVVIFSTINRNAEGVCARGRRRRISAGTAAQGHARLREIHHAGGTCGVCASGGARAVRHHRRRVQPVRRNRSGACRRPASTT